MKKQLISMFLLFANMGWAFASFAQEPVGRLARTVGRQVAGLSGGVASSTRKFIPINLDIWQPLPPEMTGYTRSIFRARSLAPESGHTFSGVVFKTQYKGKNEIYGVVAAHTLSPDLTKELLGEEFAAEVFTEGGFVEVRAKLAQISAPSIMDLALVKFNPEDEKLFTPLALATEEVSTDSKVSGVGFGQGKFVFTPKRRLLQNTPLSLRTSLALPLEDRPGLCGSAVGMVLNNEYKLAGIHVGSTRKAGSKGEDIGYATPAKWLNTLVEAYHNDGKATFPLYIDGQQIALLGVDEFVSFIRLKDEKGKIIWRRAVHEKFPYNEIVEVLPWARYIELSIGRAIWTGNYLREETLNPRQVQYDLQRRK